MRGCHRSREFQRISGGCANHQRVARTSANKLRCARRLSRGGRRLCRQVYSRSRNALARTDMIDISINGAFNAARAIPRARAHRAML